MRYRFVCIVAALAVWTVTTGAQAAELQPKTVAAFERYVKVTEVRMDRDKAFLWADALPPSQSRETLDGLRRGGLVIERLRTNAGRKAIDIPDGLVHHWLGVVFIPGASLENAVKLLQDYNRHAVVYNPTIVRSRLISREGDQFRFFLRIVTKKIITVVVNTENVAHFSRPGPGKAVSRIYSTRIAEVENPGTPEEREKPVGNDGGYLWRLNTYWRFLERDGGTYVQCESISLTRGIPPGFGWLVGPFVTSVPRESLVFTLETTRKALTHGSEKGLL